jgi:lantibiotic modifying enzyme
MHAVSGAVTAALPTERARAAAEMITRRMAQPEQVAAAVRSAQQASQYPFGFGGASLFSGLIGSSLLFRYAARVPGQPAEEWASLAHESLMQAVRATHDEPMTDGSLASGTAGLALVLDEAARDDPRYTNAQRSVRAKLVGQVLEIPSWRGRNGLWDAHYDIVTGVAGTLAYLASIDDPDDAVRQAAGRIIDDLVWVCTPGGESGTTPWHLAPEHYPTPDHHARYPHGYVNLGMAHGIPGVLAAMSLAYLAGYRRPGLAAAIRHAAGYLTASAIEDDHGVTWTTGIGLDASGRDLPAAGRPSRIAWCYGAPGVARGLLHAAQALADHEMKRFATGAFDAVLRRCMAAPVFDSVTLCHGAAGVLMLCGEFDSELTHRGSVVLAEQVLAACAPETILGVQDVEPPGILLDSPGLLTGATGVALALWTVGGRVDRRWLRALLVS